MAFAINPTTLDTHSAKLSALADAVATADSYAADHLVIGLVDTSFTFAGVIGDCDKVREALLLMQKDLTSALQASSLELGGTARRSRELDDALEAQLDSAYPGTVDPAARLSLPSAQTIYMTPSEPGALLTAPVDEGVEDLFTQILGVDWLSPSYWLMEIMNSLLTWDPVDLISKKFSGNWNALFTYESALNNLGRFHKAQGDNIAHEMSMTANSWEGEASDAANAFFTAMAATARTTGDDLIRIAPEFATLARAMKKLGENVGGLMTSAMDAMLVAAVIYAAGAATAATGVGAIVGALGGSAALVTAVVMLDKAWTAISTVMGIVTALSMAIEFFSTYDVSESAYSKPLPYDNPTVD